ncbi:MAG: hypothetical protein V7641_3833 [Blastocatellia bacterium]
MPAFAHNPIRILLVNDPRLSIPSTTKPFILSVTPAAAALKSMDIILLRQYRTESAEVYVSTRDDTHHLTCPRFAS